MLPAEIFAKLWTNGFTRRSTGGYIAAFSHYEEILRRTSADQTFADLLLFLLKAEYEQRQENKNQRRLK